MIGLGMYPPSAEFFAFYAEILCLKDKLSICDLCNYWWTNFLECGHRPVGQTEVPGQPWILPVVCSNICMALKQPKPIFVVKGQIPSNVKVTSTQVQEVFRWEQYSGPFGVLRPSSIKRGTTAGQWKEKMKDVCMFKEVILYFLGVLWMICKRMCCPVSVRVVGLIDWQWWMQWHTGHSRKWGAGSVLQGGVRGRGVLGASLGGGGVSYLIFVILFTQPQFEAWKFYTWKCKNSWQKLPRDKTA